MTSPEAKFRSFPNEPLTAAQKERLACTREHLIDRDETIVVTDYSLSFYSITSVKYFFALVIQAIHFAHCGRFENYKNLNPF